ncbi:MAG: hypothetical protein U0R64_08120 [Candidatus Nanopelagicales bacterium]
MSIPGLENPPTTNKKLIEWVEETAALTQPDRVEWCDGSEEEWNRLTQLMVDGGTFIRLNEETRPNSFLARSNPSDVMQVEDRTFICSLRRRMPVPQQLDGPPGDARDAQAPVRGCMRGRTMYVIPFSMGPLGFADLAVAGVGSPDSPCVVTNMKIMTRMGREALDLIGEDGDFVPALRRSATR